MVGAPATAQVDLSAFTSRWVIEWLATQPDRLHRRLDDAALVFLDISGFTAMSEMLASLGRIGSEEVREVVNATFTSLLDLAYGEGASLLKFGGDALLLLFEGPEANDAAIRTAWAVRERLHARNPATTAAGSLDLDLTVGVHAGPVDLFLVGGSHRELVIAGPAGTAVIHTESKAERGRILLSPDVAARPGVDVTRREDGLRELRKVTDRTRAEPAPRAVSQLPTDLHVLSPLVRDRVTEDRRGEHRHATIAFVHFSGTDALLQHEGAEGLACALQQLTTVIQDACEATKVCLLSTDIDEDGGKFILTAGVPVAADDDDDRMVSACRRIVDARLVLPLQVGINRGPVFAGVVGPEYRLTYTVLGDAVNLAARIMARAEHGQVLAEVGVMNRCRTLYDATALPPFNVKGKQAPVRALAIGDELGVRIRIRSDDTPFVGREPLLAHLTERVDGLVVGGAGSALALTGPAGIGKSRVIDELQERRPQVQVQLIACSRFGAERPYRAAGMLLRLVLTGERHGDPMDVVAAARRLAKSHDGLAQWLPLLGDVYDVDLPDTPQTKKLAPAFRGPETRRVLGLLLASAMWGPAVIVVEDVQWLDPESRELLVELHAHVLQDRPWLILGTARDPADLVEGMDALEVDGLATAAVRRLLLTAVDRGQVTMDWTSAIAERAAGNPLFLIELIRAAGEGSLPDSLESLFQHRLDALPAGHRRLLSHAAVLGLEFPPALLDALAMDQDISTVDLAGLSEFITQMRSGYWRFTQSLHQEVAYAALPYRTRRELHRRAAEALERMQSAGQTVAIEALSRHHHLGGDHAKSWHSSRHAFTVARDRSAVESAARFARRALEAGRRSGAPDEEMASVWEGLGDALELSGAYADAELAYRSARRHGAGSAEARLCRRIGQTKERTGHYSQALRWYTKSLRAATTTRPDSTGEQVETQVRRAVTLMRQGRRTEGWSVAAALQRSDLPLTPLQRAYVLWIEGWRAVEEQDIRVAEKVLTESGRLFADAGELGMQAVVHNALGAAQYFHGDWSAATRRYTQARDLWRQAGDRGNEAVANANLGEVLGDQGHHELAMTTLDAAHQFGQATHHETLRVMSKLYLGRTAARAGMHSDADAHLQDALHGAERLGASGLVVEAHLRLAELALFAGDLDALKRHERRAMQEAGPSPHPSASTWSLRLRGCLAMESGDPVLAKDLLEQALTVASSAEMTFEELLARIALDEYGLQDHGEWVAKCASDLGLACAPEVLLRGLRRVVGE